MNRLLQIATSTATVVFILETGVLASETGSHEVTIAETLRLAEMTSPNLKESSEREIEANLTTTIARSNLLPKFDLSAVDSFGFPGSGAPVPSEFGGLLTSPFRIGPTAGVLGRLSLFDLSYWHGLEEANENAHATTEEAHIARLKVDQTALDIFFEAARLRGESEAWKDIVEKLDSILKTVRKFVRNGQYSDVQRLLLEDQLNEAQMKRAVAEDHYRMALKRLALLTGLNDSAISCPSAVSLDDSSLRAISSGKKSPLIGHAEAQIRAAKAGASKFSAQHLPKLYALGSAGFMENSRLVGRQNYSAWVGITIPLFEGFKISAEAQRADAIANEREDNLSATQLALDDLNTRYDDTIRSTKIQLDFLVREQAQAIEAFNLTRKRYLSFLEPVLNLKEAVRNLARIKTQLSESKAGLLRAKASKLILNGGTAMGQ